MISLCALMLAQTSRLAAQDHGPDLPKASMRFDLPTQPLADALYAFSSLTGLEVLVPEEMLVRRQSSRVAGVLVPDDALRALLSGTGLALRSTGLGAFTLVEAAPDTSFPTGRMPRYPQYSAALQAAVTKVLCQLRETQPGGYRVAARLWVGRSGEVTRIGLLGTTGSTERDDALASLFRRVVISEPPPADLPQPTTVVVLPRQAAAECANAMGRAP